MHVKQVDDFEWQRQYPAAHAAQTIDLESKNRFELPEKFDVSADGTITYDDPPLIDNLQFLYEQVYKLQPKTVFEVGFGYCNHLVSLNRLLPDTQFSACDISTSQMDGAYKRYGAKLADFELFISDFLLFNTSKKYDLVYSQAVVMHMSTERSMQAIEKMCELSNKYVLSLDGGLVIPNIRGWLETLGKVTFFDDFADKYWSSNNICPFLIEV